VLPSTQHLRHDVCTGDGTLTLTTVCSPPPHALTPTRRDAVTRLASLRRPHCGGRYHAPERQILAGREWSPL